ncbi:PadR family transcriptional regulator [Nocardia sp. NPDC047038]|uniref:PadR family transcriptional regulator n=1 Tax=Nocardia sp. NPDC047038 TaxID=3154338 RepID=UPI0033F6157E
MPSRPLRSPVALAALGLLAEHPRHVYDMRKVMRERGYEQALGLKNATLYDALPRLAGAGLIEHAGTVRDSSRPERVVYRITDSGVATLLDWLREWLGSADHDHNAFTVALAFMFALPKDEVAELVSRRAQQLDAQLAEVEAGLAAAPAVPPIFLTDHTYRQTLRRAERDWLLTFADDLRGERLSWPVPE